MRLFRSSTAPLAALTLLLCLAASARADIDAQELDDSWSLRQGDKKTCPEKIEIDTKGDALVVTPGELQIDEKDCEGDGELKLVLNPRPPTTLAGVTYLRDPARTASIGDVIAGTVSAQLSCGTFTLPSGTQFAVVEPEKDVDVKWADMFGSTAPLANEGDKSVELDDGTKYLFYGNGVCFYAETRIKDRVCFPAAAKATLRSGRRVRMDELNVGDDVLVGAGEFSPVIGWTHRDTGKDYTFVRLTTASGHALTATHGHFVRADGELRPMRKVHKGMTLTLADGRLSVVVDKTTVRDSGLYNPQTAHGDIVVDDVVASTYTTAVRPTVAHTMLAPVRAAYCVAGRVGSALFMSWA